MVPDAELEMTVTRADGARCSSWSAIRRAFVWVLFYLGFALSPLTPWNDALVNQLPSAVIASWIHHATGQNFQAWYVACYVATNILGFLLMLPNVGELVRRWRRVAALYREDRRRLCRMLAFDILTFAAFAIVGQLLLN
jgi:hypothetical protein